MKRPLIIAALLFCFPASLTWAESAEPDSAGFIPMFNGRDLSGWEGKPGWWTVENGVLTSESTAEKPCQKSHYLYWTEAEPEDFEMHCEFKISSQGNSGIQFRSQRRPDFDTWGYQADMDGAGQYLGCLYQHERGLVAERGQRVRIDTQGEKQIQSFKDSKTLLQVVEPEQWNRYRVVAKGPLVQLWINDVLMCEVEDHEPRLGLRGGLIALQMHQGPPMKVQYKNLRIRIDNPFFAMDNGVVGSPQQVAETLSEIGYAGLGGRGPDAAKMSETLRQRGLRLFNVYTVLTIDDASEVLDDPMRQWIDSLENHDTALWISITKVIRDGKAIPFSSDQGDAIVLKQIGEVADYAATRGVRVAFYPHANCWLERFEDAVRLAEKMDRANVGSTFNLCHWLKVDGDHDPSAALASARERLFFVSINGADGGDTQSMGWDRLIQTLDRGSYDVDRLLATLRQIRYAGPIGLQCYNVPGDKSENLRKSMQAWQAMTTTPSFALPSEQ